MHKCYCDNKSMVKIRDYFENVISLSDRDWNMFASKLVREEYPKKHTLLEAGQTENYLSFIEKGIVRFFIPKDNNDLTFGFGFDHGFISAYDSFLTQQPSFYTVQSLAPVTLWRISFHDLQIIYRETEAGNHIGRHASEELFLKKSNRERSLLEDSAETRYFKLYTEQPKLIQQIPLKLIASYIGITPQALSRIRRRIS